MIKACLFDLDGVLVDTAVFHYQAWRRMANELGFDITEHQNEDLKGISREESLEIILNWGGIQLTAPEKKKWTTQKNEWYLDLVSQMKPAHVLEGARELLLDLKQNKILIGLGSSSKNALLILEKVELLSFFDVIIDGNELQKGKPNPEVFLKGAERLQVPPKNCIVFEDAVSGIEAAVLAGMKSVGIGSAPVLAKATVVVSSLRGINYIFLTQL